MGSRDAYDKPSWCATKVFEKVVVAQRTHIPGAPKRPLHIGHHPRSELEQMKTLLRWPNLEEQTPRRQARIVLTQFETGSPTALYLAAIQVIVQFLNQEIDNMAFARADSNTQRVDAGDNRPQLGSTWNGEHLMGCRLEAPIQTLLGHFAVINHVLRRIVAQYCRASAQPIFLDQHPVQIRRGGSKQDPSCTRVESLMQGIGDGKETIRTGKHIFCRGQSVRWSHGIVAKLEQGLLVRFQGVPAQNTFVSAGAALDCNSTKHRHCRLKLPANEITKIF